MTMLLSKGVEVWVADHRTAMITPIGKPLESNESEVFFVNSGDTVWFPGPCPLGGECSVFQVGHTTCHVVSALAIDASGESNYTDVVERGMFCANRTGEAEAENVRVAMQHRRAVRDVRIALITVDSDTIPLCLSAMSYMRAEEKSLPAAVAAAPVVGSLEAESGAASPEKRRRLGDVISSAMDARRAALVATLPDVLWFSKWQYDKREVFDMRALFAMATADGAFSVSTFIAACIILNTDYFSRATVITGANPAALFKAMLHEWRCIPIHEEGRGRRAPHGMPTETTTVQCAFVVTASRAARTVAGIGNADLPRNLREPWGPIEVTMQKGQTKLLTVPSAESVRTAAGAVNAKTWNDASAAFAWNFSYWVGLMYS
jgi:hypothetical protein